MGPTVHRPSRYEDCKRTLVIQPNEAIQSLRRGKIMHPLIENHRLAIRALAARYGVTDVRVFGSMSRGDADEQSDVDLLVRPLPDTSLLELGGLVMDAQALLGRRVDVVTERALNPRIRERVLREAQPL